MGCTGCGGGSEENRGLRSPVLASGACRSPGVQCIFFFVFFCLLFSVFSEIDRVLLGGQRVE